MSQDLPGSPAVVDTFFARPYCAAAKSAGRGLRVGAPSGSGAPDRAAELRNPAS
jgi:hypothetical protein